MINKDIPKEIRNFQEFSIATWGMELFQKKKPIEVS